MVTTKELIEENNEKRESLTVENEKYYSNLLMYIRSRLTLSERSIEEVLMEMLDHLLEGQEEGKTAEDIFGEDPLGYADELIEQLPKEKKRDLIAWGSQIVINTFGWILILRGVVLLILSKFIEIDERIFLYSSLVLVITVCIGMGVVVWIFLHMLRASVQNKKEKSRKIEVIGGLSIALVWGSVVAIPYFNQEQGPVIPFSWYWSIIIGGVLWLIGRVIKRKVEAK